MTIADVLPHFPKTTEIQEHHRNLLKDRFNRVQPQISELTFAYLWSWRSHTHCRLSHYEDNLMILCDLAGTPDHERAYAYAPLGGDHEQRAHLIERILHQDNGLTQFSRVPRATSKLISDNTRLQVEDNRERADYVHRADTLRELPGNDFHGKRNLIKQFERGCPHAEFRMIDGPLAARCSHFSQQWLDNHPKNANPALQREVATTRKMLARMEWLGLSGGALLDDDRIIAFALGEPLNQTTFIERVEKADTSYPGSYQAINRAFARHVAESYQWINREQDLGVEGLRRAKMSYHPDHLIRKYTVRQIGTQ